MEEEKMRALNSLNAGQSFKQQGQYGSDTTNQWLISEKISAEIILIVISHSIICRSIETFGKTRKRIEEKDLG